MPALQPRSCQVRVGEETVSYSVRRAVRQALACQLEHVRPETGQGHPTSTTRLACGFQCIPPTHTDFKPPIVLTRNRPPF